MSIGPGEAKHNLWRPFLASARFVVLDGGLATELERRGARLDDALWSAKLLLDNPELIRQIHEEYFRAGADIGTSASYQATLPGLMRRGLSPHQAADTLRLSVRLVREARDRFWADVDHRPGRHFPLVAASLGSYGAFLANGAEFHGDYELSAKELIDWHRPRLEVLATGEADVLAFETVPCLREGEALVRLLEEFPQIQAWLSFSCRDGRHLCHGETFAEAVRVSTDATNVVAVGINCTAPRHIDELLASVGTAQVPLMVYPNSGEVWNAETRNWIENTEVENWEKAALRWRELGADIIGGCCRTTPGTIRRIRNSLDAQRRSPV